MYEFNGYLSYTFTPSDTMSSYSPLNCPLSEKMRIGVPPRDIKDSLYSSIFKFFSSSEEYQGNIRDAKSTWQEQCNVNNVFLNVLMSCFEDVNFTNITTTWFQSAKKTEWNQFGTSTKPQPSLVTFYRHQRKSMFLKNVCSNKRQYNFPHFEWLWHLNLHFFALRLKKSIKKFTAAVMNIEILRIIDIMPLMQKSIIPGQRIRGASWPTIYRAI